MTIKTKDEILMAAIGVPSFSILHKFQKEQLYWAMDEWAAQNQPNGNNMVLAASGPTDDEINAHAKLTCNQYDTHTGRIIHQAAYETGARWARNLIRAACSTAKGRPAEEQLPCPKAV